MTKKTIDALIRKIYWGNRSRSWVTQSVYL